MDGLTFTGNAVPNIRERKLERERDEALAEIERLNEELELRRAFERDQEAEVERLTRLNERARHNARGQKAKADRYREAIRGHRDETKCCDECVDAQVADAFTEHGTADGRLWAALDDAG